MIDDDLVLRVERLRDSLDEFKGDLRRRYRNQDARVGAAAVREAAAQLAERWLVEVAARDDVRVVITDEVLADLNIDFQRLLTNSEGSVPRRRYDAPLSSILGDFRSKVVIPLKQARGSEVESVTVEPASNTQSSELNSAFVGQSFASEDTSVNETIKRFLRAFGLTVITGEKPAAQTVSSKVRDRIDRSDIFVGVFTRRHKLASGEKWTASEWIVDEKAYALAKNKILILLKEKGVQSIGGLQGDYEYLEFDRNELHDLLVRLLEVLRPLAKVGGG